MTMTSNNTEQKILIPLLKDMESKLILNPDDSYLKTYEYFIQYFKELNPIESNNAVIGSSMIYSWMPRILKINFNRLEQCTEILNKAKQSSGLTLTNADFEIVQEFANNSLVGTSKLLHFINPECFPIWDSNIAKYCFKKSDSITMSSISNYLQYRNNVLGIAEDKDFQPILGSVQKKLKANHHSAEITAVRAVEMIIFYFMKNSRAEKLQSS